MVITMFAINTYEEIEKNIKSGKPFALRLKSQGDSNKTFEFVLFIC